jgi:hypothetical protein
MPLVLKVEDMGFTLTLQKRIIVGCWAVLWAFMLVAMLLYAPPVMHLSLPFRRITRLIASPPASHRVASHRIASHRIASHARPVPFRPVRSGTL